MLHKTQCCIILFISMRDAITPLMPGTTVCRIFLLSVLMMAYHCLHMLCPLHLSHQPQGDNMFNLFGTNLMGGLFSSPAAYMLAAAAIMIPTVWLPDLSALSTLGFVGVSATCTVTATVSSCCP